MSISIRSLVIVAALLAAFPAPAASQAGRKDDVVTMKDGRIIRGKIIEFFPNDSTFLMRLPDGTFVRYNKAEIAHLDQGNAERWGEKHTSLKSPPLSWLLSFVVPGGGQIYNGDVAIGVGIMAMAGTGAALYFTSDPEECEVKDECQTKRTVGAVIMAAAWLGSQIQAPLKANAINREVRSRVSWRLWPEPHPLGVTLARVDF